MTVNRRCFLASIIASVVREPAPIFTKGEEMVLYEGSCGGGKSLSARQFIILRIDYATKTVTLGHA